MPWEYLKTKPFERRYAVVAEFLKDKIENPVVADIDCGEPLFKNYIDYSEYLANDVTVPDDLTGVKFDRKLDTEVDYKADVLCLFGYGGGELTGVQLESQTVRDSFLRMATHKPRFIVIEMVQKWEDDFGAMTWFEERLPNYGRVFEKVIRVEPVDHYHNIRMIRIYELG